MPNLPYLSLSLVLAECWPIAGSLILNEWSPGACFLSHTLLMSLSTESVSSPRTRLKSPREMPTISHCEDMAQPMLTRSLPKERGCDLPEAFRAVAFSRSFSVSKPAVTSNITVLALVRRAVCGHQLVLQTTSPSLPFTP